MSANDDESADVATADDRYVEEANEPDPQFEPLITLPLIDLITNEEDEEELWSGRTRLYRYDENEHTKAMEWKERGTGQMKLLLHNVRLVMRRDQTHKVCANHAIMPLMMLTPHNQSDRTWVWTTLADFSDLEQRAETLAVRFKNHEIAMEFRKKFMEAREIMSALMGGANDDARPDDDYDDTDDDDQVVDAADKPNDESSEKHEKVAIIDAEKENATDDDKVVISKDQIDDVLVKIEQKLENVSL